MMHRTVAIAFDFSVALVETDAAPGLVDLLLAVLCILEFSTFAFPYKASSVPAISLMLSSGVSAVAF
jgi:hypothetical protein